MVKGLLGPSLRGIDTHGVRLLPTYIKELQGGRSKARPNIRFAGRFPAAVSMDADQALGVVAAYEAVERSMEVADQYGTATVSVSNSNHFGAASNYSLAAAEEGFLCICTSNADSLVAAHNGRTKLLGTNPVSFSAPGDGNDVFSLDMATSQVSLSAVLQHLARGKPLKDNWVVDKDLGGESPLLPLGGYKGQGLGMMISILSCMLNDASMDVDMSHFYSAPFDQARNVGHCFITIKIEAFVEPAFFQGRVSALLQTIRESDTLPNGHVMAPGDQEAKSAASRSSSGVPLNSADAAYFAGLAEELGFSIQNACEGNDIGENLNCSLDHSSEGA